MKKVYLIAVCLFATLFVNAQIKKQSILLGGGFSYYNNEKDFGSLNQKTQNGNISISVGKAIKENKVVGITFSYSPYKRTDNLTNGDTFNLTSKEYSVGGFYRRYKNLGKDFYFFAEADAAFFTGNREEIYRVSAGRLKATYRGGRVALTPGISYQLFRKLQVELSIDNIVGVRYATSKIKSDVSTPWANKEKDFALYSNLDNSSLLGYFSVGFRFIL